MAAKKSGGSGAAFLIALGVLAFWYHAQHGTPAAVTAAAAAGPHRYYTAQQLGALWQQAGGPSWATADAVCIAEHESAGDAQATDRDRNGTVDRGLWQINSIWGWRSTYDPLANAQAAVFISRDGSSWRLWTTHYACGL